MNINIFSFHPLTFLAGALLTRLAVNKAIEFPFHLYRKSIGIEFAKTEYMTKDPLNNLIRLANASPEQIASRICPLSTRQQVPSYIHLGRTSDSTIEVQQYIKVVNFLPVTFGLFTAASLSSYIFNQCIQNSNQWSPCMEEHAAFLTKGNLGLLLVSTTFIAYKVGNVFFKALITSDFMQNIRYYSLIPEYTKLNQTFIQLIKNSEVDVVKKAEVTALAKGLLCNMPLIKKELVSFVGLTNEQAENLTIYLNATSKRAELV